MSVEAGQELAHYRLIEQIGEGGTGTVWKALDSRLHREVALKLLSASFTDDPDRMARFEHEARVVAALNHPGIVTVHAVEEAAGQRFFSMELVRGTTLAELIPQGGLPFKRFIEIAISTVEALAVAHQAGIVHGDLKPGNVMVTDTGGVKVLDFGLARKEQPVPVVVTPDSPTVTLPDNNRISGTICYMSPEQIQGHALDTRSDIFALGIMLYEMATGRRPFRGETAADVIASVLRDRPVPPSRINPEIPRQLDRVIERCLAKSAEQREQTGVGLRDELRALARYTDARREESVRSIAVLPFADMSPERDQDFFCEGMADEILTAISRIDDLRVVSRSSSFRFKGSTLDSREIGDRLGVGTLLEGSVRKSGERLRISVQVVDVDNGYQLWAQRYDRRLRDVFAIQEEIAENIVAALELTLTPSQRRAIKQVATDSVQAYESYLRGRQCFRQFRRRSIEFAQQMFARAIEIDPNYAGAYAGLADCCSYLYMFWEMTEKNLRRADEASRKAVELDGELAEAYVSRGVAISLGGRHDEAAREFETAIRLSPKLWEAHYFYARGFYAQGRLEQAVAGFERAIEARPEDYQAHSLLGSALTGLGRKEESAAAYRNTVELAQRHLELHPGDARALYFSAIAMCQLGEREEQCIEWAERARAMDPDEPQVLYNVGCAYALLGRADEAIDCLGRTIEHGGWWRGWMRNDPDLVCLSGDPRFQAMVEPA